ncbi:MAG: hypothetical protein GSR72_04080 [Desulfurococcales archaeon]|nr:hypothetical protein [Desulfurococcales archaeon]
MRILLFHAERLYYKTLKKALKKPPDPPGEGEYSPCVVAFITIEAGDNNETVNEAASNIVDYTVNQVKEKTIVLYPYAHLSSELAKPPKAHKLLIDLEAEVRKIFDGQVHRVPFGWYKKLEISVKGHPLSELSRTIKVRPILFVIGGKPYKSVKEAVGGKIVPDWILNTPRIYLNESKLLRQKLEVFETNHCTSWQHQEIARRIHRKIESLTETLLQLKENTLNVKGVEALLYYTTHDEASPGVYTGKCVLEETFYVINTSNTREILEALYEGFSQENLVVYEYGDLKIYGAKISDYTVPLAASKNDKTVIGPLKTIFETILARESIQAEKEGKTPYLPIWLHPITLALIPVSEKVTDYTRTLAQELAGRGVNVELLGPGQSIGTRIRYAAKRWIPYTVVIGEREVATGTVTVRRRWETGRQEVLPVTSLVDEVTGILRYHGVLGRIFR